MKPKTLSIDIETYSSVDLGSCGVYKYAEADDFEILLFAYSYDYGDVQIVKLAEGELIPDEVLDYLYDKDVEKTAFNAAFERTCLTKALGRYCEPEQWSCTMVLAASCGLPMSLKGVGAALGLSEEKAKMKEGADLIRYFCVPCRPTKTNGGRTRNLPIHAPDKWETFCRYNIRDVEVENTIRGQLLKWRPNYSEQKLWCLDQRMNDKGVRIEPKLAENAIRIGDQYREKLIGQAKEISGLENPNSTAQIKAWLEEQEDIEVLSLNKKAIANVYSQLSADETKAVLQLREEFSKSSNKKYEAFLRSCCKDDHVRGTFQFYGASTGRWCLTGDHEVLTPDGWVRLDEWDGGMIACWNMQQEGLSFQKSKALEFDYSGEMLVIDSQRCAQISTPDHKMAYTKRGQYPWRTATMAELYGRRFDIPFTGRRYIAYPTDPDIIRVLIMVQADGHYDESNILSLRFTKDRKIIRCKQLLRRVGIPYSIRKDKDGTTEFCIPSRHQPIWLRSFSNKEFGWWMLNEDPRVIVEELEHWDGYREGPNSIQYITCNKHNAEVIQAVCVLGGYSATLLVKSREHRKPNWSTAYYVNIWLTPGRYTEIRSEHQSKIDYCGKVYCASTPTGFFLVRRDGRVWITGNSGRLVQLQNLPHDTLPDLDDARMLALLGDEEDFECMYPKVQSALSALIRTMIIPEDGQILAVADFSSIEARVIAWLSDEQWRLDAFSTGKDIYCESASRAFGIPVEKHGQNSEYRKYGKVIELACGYGGSTGAMLNFGADKLGMTEEQMVELVDKWRDASPHIVA